MATITIKNMPRKLHIALKKRSAINRRSLNNEIIYCLEEAVQLKKLPLDEFLTEVKKNRESMDTDITNDILNESARR